MSQDKSNNFLSPTRGYQWRIEARHASPIIGSDTALAFNKLVAERSHYWGVGGGSVIDVTTVRAGAVFGRSFRNTTGFIPPQERLYAGGPTSVRGFPQNGSAIYIAESYALLPRRRREPADSVFRDTTTRATPKGSPGRWKLAHRGNLELRMPSPFLAEFLQWTVFTDAGDVWNRGRLEA